MEGSFEDAEVLSYQNSSILYCEIEKLYTKKNISFTRNDEDVVLEVCGEGEVVCLFRPKAVDEELLYFYLGVLDDFKMQLPFTYFNVDLLTTMNMTQV